MVKRLLIFLLVIFFGHNLQAQAFDSTTYYRLIDADNDGFTKYARSVGLTVIVDTVLQSITARHKGCLYIKPLGDKSNNEYYDLVLIVSTPDKEKNKLILKNAREDTAKKGTWNDNKYLYMEMNSENTMTNEMWYKLVVYRKK